MARDAEPALAAASLARGGRTNFAGFLLRLAARFPFLLLAARLYGAGELGEFAYAVMVVEFTAALATMGLKRGLSAEMARGGHPETHALADGWLLGLGLAMAGSALLWLFPALMFPAGADSGLRGLALIVPAIVLSDVSLAGLAFFWFSAFPNIDFGRWALNIGVGPDGAAVELPEGNGEWFPFGWQGVLGLLRPGSRRAQDGPRTGPGRLPARRHSVAGCSLAWCGPG